MYRAGRRREEARRLPESKPGLRGVLGEHVAWRDVEVGCWEFWGRGPGEWGFESLQAGPQACEAQRRVGVRRKEANDTRGQEKEGRKRTGERGSEEGRKRTGDSRQRAYECR
eukprot:2148325-Rhodomonas_salina.2